MNNNLLPPNATKLERDLETVIAHSTDLPVAIRTLWNPWTCPASLLPWLAWANSVDDWQESWPERVKRQVIADAFGVHAHKGTPWAVQRALDSLGIKTDIREWWEPGGSGQRGTMTVTALLNDNITGTGEGLINADTLRLVTRAVNNSKRGSIHFDVELGISFAESLGLAAGIASGVGISITEPDSLPVLPDALTATASMAAGIHRLDCADHDAAMLPVLPDAISAATAVAGISYRMHLHDHELTGVA